MAERKEMQEEETRRDEEEILSPREIAIIERWMEKHGITLEEPIFYPEDPWQFAIIETIEVIRDSRKRRILKDLPKAIQERLWRIADEMLFSDGSRRVLIEEVLPDFIPAQSRVLDHQLKEMVAGKRKEFTGWTKKELTDKTKKLKKDLPRRIEKVQRTPKEVMEEKDRPQKTRMKERRQWKEDRSRLAKKLNALRSEKKERPR